MIFLLTSTQTEMTNEQILELAEICGVKKRWDENLFKCREDQLLEFVREIERKVWKEGFDDGYVQGRYDATGEQ